MHEYDFIGDIRMSTQLISIQPWALVVNTTGQLISLTSSTNVFCTLENMSVTTPPAFVKVRVTLKLCKFNSITKKHRNS